MATPVSGDDGKRDSDHKGPVGSAEVLILSTFSVQWEDTEE